MDPPWAKLLKVWNSELFSKCRSISVSYVVLGGVYFEDIEPLAFPKLWVNAFVLASDPDIGGYRHQ